MNAPDLISSAVANTFRSKLRTTLTVLAIFVGAFTLTLTNAIGAGVSDYVDKQVAAMGSADMLFVTKATEDTASGDGPAKYDPEAAQAARGSGGPGPRDSDPLTDEDLETIRGTPGIVDADPLRMVAPQYISYDGGTAYELTANPVGSIARADLEAGRQLESGTEEHQIVLPSTYLEPLGFDSAEQAVGSSVQLGITDALGEQRTVKATVVGVAREGLLASGASMNEALLAELSEVRSAGIDTGPVGHVAAIAYFDTALSGEEVDALKSSLAQGGYQAQTTEDQLGMVQTVISGIVGILNAFAVIALVAASFGIINTLLMSVQERTREIGLMKAMGMSGGRVFALFSLEAVVIGFLGSAIGAAAAVGLGSTVSAVLAEGALSGLPGLSIMVFQPLTVAGVIGLIMVIAFLAGTLPARKAARQNPIDALRYE
ncbi:ABC transporter permease [Kocuria rosea]|uniref:ABC transporter permease n=1 Tax=Kocuria rosea TaxID=1275 RepID=UPI0020410FEC|nr:ABC transporter permease [Kocuria rosea]